MRSKEELKEIWYKLGMSNFWIREADDPEFSKDMLYECKTLDELIEKFEHGNWCLGQGFYYKDICFINQIDGGCEWLTIKDDIAFESMSCGLMLRREGRGYFIELIERIEKAEKEDLLRYNY